MPMTGLRERKKSATKDALSNAALDLALAHGLDAVTAEAIAEQAGVSTRTFHNYFSSKEAAVLFVLNKPIQEAIAVFAQRRAGEPILDSLEAMQINFAESGDGLDRMLAITRLMADHPALTAKHAATFNPAIDALLAEIGYRTGTDPEVDLYPWLVYHATWAIARGALELHMHRASSGHAFSRPALVATIHDGYAQLRRGLPQPEPDMRHAQGKRRDSGVPRTHR